MKAKAMVSVGVVLGSSVFVGMLMSACSSDNTNSGSTAGAPGASGNNTTTGGVATGGGGAASGGGGASSQGGGLMMVDGKCPPNSIKHPDMLCYCQPATLTACASGCGDLMTDPDRCGNCDTKCMPTQACSAGKCTPAPTALVPAAAGCGAIHLATAGSTLYWTDKMHGTVSSVAKTGGAPAVLAMNQMAPTLLTATATSLFWLASGAKSIMTSPISGMTPMAVFTPPAMDDIGGFTLSADGMSVIYSTKTSIMKTTAAPGGTPAEVGKEDSGIPRAVAAVGDFIAYPADVNGDVDVMKVVAGMPSLCASEDSMTAMNKNCNRLARSQGSLNFENIYIVGDNVYWVNGTQLSTSSASMPTGFNDTVAQTTNPAATLISAFSISDNVAYFADDAGYIYKAPLMPNATVTTLARGQMTPSSIVSDGTNVYWATSDCAIMSLPLK
jgi:hypothetical protein